MNATSKWSSGESITSFAKQKTEGMGSIMAKINLTKPLEIFDTMVANQQWDSLGRILTSPDGLKTMEKLATTPAAIRNWRLLIAPLFVGGNKMEDKETIQKKYENQFKGIMQ